MLTFLRRLFSRSVTTQAEASGVPAFIQPVLDLGTGIMQYCRFARIEPESLLASDELSHMVNGQPSILGVTVFSRLIQEGCSADLVMDFLVQLGDAQEEERGPFKAYLANPTCSH